MLLTGNGWLTNPRRMWGIELIDAEGERVDEVVFPGPLDTIRDWCRSCLDARPDVRIARLKTPDGLLEYVYPEELAPV